MPPPPPTGPAKNDTISVLFVCLGNICRSPLAEGVFLFLAEREGVDERFDVDSCGTGGWHVGERPDKRSIAVARKHGVSLPGRARKLEPEADVERFDWLIALDQSVRSDMLAEGVPKERVRLLRSFDPSLNGSRRVKLDVPDPYWSGPDGFEKVYAMIHAACRGMVEELL